jgi:ABC-type Mn2+/Zn2+ transport system ATPase subunit
LNDESLEIGEIVLTNFCGYWSRDPKEPHLKKINLHLKPKGFYGIAGKVGAGKSGLLSAILQEVPYYSG